MEVVAASDAVCQHLARWPRLQEARTVLAYLAFRNEVDVSTLFAALPHVRWVLPRIVWPHLALHIYDPARLVRHPYGMLEPDPALPTIDPADLDIVLVPGVAFDVHGGRLGFGGGFYDRLLPTTAALRVGVTYDDCLLDAVPCDPHDQHMDWVVTPAGLIQIV